MNPYNSNSKVAGDTLPVGSVIDYDGEEVPANWEKVENEKIVWEGTVTSTGDTTITLNKDIEENKRYRFYISSNNDYLSNTLIDIPGKLLYNSSQSVNKSHVQTGKVAYVGEKNIYLIGLRIYKVGSNQITFNRCITIQVGNYQNQFVNAFSVIKIVEMED